MILAVMDIIFAIANGSLKNSVLQRGYLAMRRPNQLSYKDTDFGKFQKLRS